MECRSLLSEYDRNAIVSGMNMLILEVFAPSETKVKGKSEHASNNIN